MAPLVKQLRSNSNFHIVLCVTGQHREMLHQVLELFDIVPDIDLSIMQKNQELSDITSSIIIKVRDVLKQEKPDIVLVHGDTTTALASSLAAFYCGVKVGHIEAGLRTYNLEEPFPEEFNRQTISKIASLHFAPTLSSKANLVSEKIRESNIYVTGNTVIDSLLLTLNNIEKDKLKLDRVNNLINSFLNFPWKDTKIILITGHRRENFGEGFLEICSAIKALSDKYKEVKFVYPVHLNPNVHNLVLKMLGKIKNVYLIPPLDYEAFLYLLKYSYIVLTDSGGIQEEAPSLGKPVLVMRNFSERSEAIEAGTVKLVGSSKNKIFEGVADLLENDDNHFSMSRAHNPYGDGTACNKIVNVLENL